jgi:hypothetical protein
VKPELSKHVQQEMERRGIPLAVLESGLAAPAQKCLNTAMWYAINPKVEINEKSCMVRVMVNENSRARKSCHRLSHERNRKILESHDMKVIYDPEVDVLRIFFREGPIEESGR